MGLGKKDGIILCHIRVYMGYRGHFWGGFQPVVSFIKSQKKEKGKNPGFGGHVGFCPGNTLLGVVLFFPPKNCGVFWVDCSGGWVALE